MPQQPTAWEKTKTNSKAGFDKAWALLDKLGAPVNRLSNKLGSEAFWPTTLDKESDKAARILKSFCKDGFYAKEEVKEGEYVRPEEGVPKGKQRVVKKIPKEVIQNAKGLAIFTTMRTGLWVSGAGGSGILVGRLPDGSWSPPSGIMLHTAGLGFLLGVDIYDCVVVINTTEALEAFSKVRCTLGGEVSAVAGPVGMGGVYESEVHKRRAPIFTYLKSRGFYAGVQVDGTIIIERTDENERFYNERISVGNILAGKVRHPPRETKMLMDTIRAAEGFDVDEELLPHEAPPGDYEIQETPDGTHVFGIPDKEDPDPFGVLALQEQGLDIREAGTRAKPSLEEFEFNPSPNSPVQNVYRRSTDSRDILASASSRRSSTDQRRATWRSSTLSTSSRMTDSGTQTDTDDHERNGLSSPSFQNGIGRKSVGSSHYRPSINGISENSAVRPLGPPPALPPRSTPKDAGTESMQVVSPEPITSSEPVASPIVIEAPSPNPNQYRDTPTDTEPNSAIDSEEDDAVIQTATTPLASPTPIGEHSKPRLVTVHKVAPPRLPPRNPVRDNKHLGPGSEDGSSSPRSARSKSSFEVPRMDINNVSEHDVTEISSLQHATASETVDSAAADHTKSDTPATNGVNGKGERENDGFQEVQLSPVTAEFPTRETTPPVAAASAAAAAATSTETPTIPEVQPVESISKPVSAAAESAPFVTEPASSAATVDDVPAQPANAESEAHPPLSTADAKALGDDSTAEKRDSGVMRLIAERMKLKDDDDDDDDDDDRYRNDAGYGRAREGGMYEREKRLPGAF